jgi:hypothetical protein
MTFKSGALTLDGGKFSSMRTVNSSIGRVERSLMSNKERTKKVIQLVFGVTTEENINNGKLCILIRPKVNKPRE